MSTGFDVAAAAKTLAPLLSSLAKAGYGQVAEALSKWRAADFAEQLTKKLAAADRVKTMWSRDQFISLTDCYYPSAIRYAGAPARHPVNTLSAFSNRAVVVEGIVGQGKSMFMQYLFLQELSGRGAGTIPLLIPFRSFTAKRGFEAHVRDAIANLEIPASTAVVDYLAKSGRLSLLLDGFDELDSDLVSDTVVGIETMLAVYRRLTVVITSRPDSHIQKNRNMEVVQLASLDRKDFDPFLKKLGVDFVRRNEVIDAIDRSPSDIGSLISTPLMLTLVAHVYAAEHEIPAELPLFFERLFVTTFATHDRQKGGGFRRHHHTGLSERKLQLLFEAFCFLTLYRKVGRSLSDEQFATIFEVAVGLVSDSACKLEDFRLDITKVACLMLDDGFAQTSFLHLSIAEYFAAAYVRRANEKFATKFYGYAVDQFARLGVVLSFLEKIDAYRFHKFYVIPPLEAFFAELGSSENRDAGDEAWRQLFIKHAPAFEMHFRRMAGTPSYRYISSSPGNGAFSGFGQSVCEVVSRAIIDAYGSEDIPEASLIENERFFMRVEAPGVDNQYAIRLEGLRRTVGDAALMQALRGAEQILWSRLQAASRVVDADDTKGDLLDW